MQKEAYMPLNLKQAAPMYFMVQVSGIMREELRPTAKLHSSYKNEFAAEMYAI